MKTAQRRDAKHIASGSVEKGSPKGKNFGSEPAKGKRENKGGSVAQKGNRKGHAEAKIDQANKSTGRMPWH